MRWFGVLCGLVEGWVWCGLGCWCWVEGWLRFGCCLWVRRFAVLIFRWVLVCWCAWWWCGVAVGWLRFL
ncbi:hypothetical protein RA266_27860, partial [Pseudomonas syringae pv. tagetis]|uniref:hypothetical protein n=1 Tax=Pseudomonas syringae group genomosp. 7 TaxID=251699 RepID=UPI00376F50FA